MAEEAVGDIAPTRLGLGLGLRLGLGVRVRVRDSPRRRSEISPHLG